MGLKAKFSAPWNLIASFEVLEDRQEHRFCFDALTEAIAPHFGVAGDHVVASSGAKREQLPATSHPSEKISALDVEGLVGVGGFRRCPDRRLREQAGVGPLL